MEESETTTLQEIYIGCIRDLLQTVYSGGLLRLCPMYRALPTSALWACSSLREHELPSIEKASRPGPSTCTAFETGVALFRRRAETAD